jgi:uncharacterized integral membrane protein
VGITVGAEEKYRGEKAVKTGKMMMMRMMIIVIIIIIIIIIIP